MALKLALKPATAPATSLAPAEAIRAATEYRELAMEFDEIEAELKVARATLLGIVTDRRNEHLAKGVAETTIRVPTMDSNRILVVYQEKYKNLSDENIAPLQECFGSDYSLFCEENTSVALKKGTTLEELEKAVGSRAWGVLQTLVSVTKGVMPRKGAFENIAQLYKKGEKERASDLTTFVDACISSPQVRAK